MNGKLIGARGFTKKQIVITMNIAVKMTYRHSKVTRK